jgi:hypothetical protein
MQHYTFLVSEEEFDAAYARISERGIEHYADPHRQQPGALNHNDGGRGVHFMDPAGHAMELITVPYGAGPRKHMRRGPRPSPGCGPQSLLVPDLLAAGALRLPEPPPGRATCPPWLAPNAGRDHHRRPKESVSKWSCQAYGSRRARLP